MMRSIRLTALGAFLAVLLVFPASAEAAFGLQEGEAGFKVTIENAGGAPAALAGSHPYEMHVRVHLNTSGPHTEGALRDLHLHLPPGLLLTPTLEECSSEQFHLHRVSPYQESLSGESCLSESQVGVVAVHSSYAGGSTRWFGVFELAHAPGSPEAIGFSPFGIPVVLNAHIREADGGLDLDLRNLSQQIDISGFDLTLWGTPWASPTGGGEWDFQHDNERGNCLNEVNPAEHFGNPAKIEIDPKTGQKKYIPGTCSVGGDPLIIPATSYLSLPTFCGQTLPWQASVSSWEGASEEAEALSAGPSGGAIVPAGCVEPNSAAEVHLFTESAAAPTGLAFDLRMLDGVPPLYAGSRITSPAREASMSLPEGISVNPSLAAGLGVCTEADFAREALSSHEGEGCPNESKIGTVSVEGLLGIGETFKGAVYLAKPYANPYDALIAVYMVFRSPGRGVFHKAIGVVRPDPHSGRLKATFEELPELYYSHFRLTLREGQRSSLVSPPACGTYIGELEMTPYSDPELHLADLSYMEINRGEGGGACPTELAPFHPALEAGSLNSQAGAYSPFYLHMTRTDSEQEITSYSATFPPGFLGKVGGIPHCSDAAIEAAKLKTGTEELEHPSCPKVTQIGHTIAGYGVGGTLAYAPGGLYLAGPYHGSPFSVVAIDAAMVGPFDLGVVVARQAIRVDPLTAQASIDASGSDPIPHILGGIPLHLRDIRVYVDRQGFTINPTSCDVLQTDSVLTGAGADLSSPADDVAATSTDRYQLLGCPELGFAPRFRLKLKGGTTRSKYPSLRATFEPRPGQANAGYAQVTLPHSLFLAQEHIGTVCTNRDFIAEKCPLDSRLGFAAAKTPLLSEPMSGYVYLRSSTHVLPDMVADLHGEGFRIELVGRIDAGPGGGLRATFDVIPDAPVSKFTMRLFGGKHGLLVNSENLCAHPQRALARFAAHDNETESLRPRIGVKCPRHGRKKGKGGK
jgi:hypothetical protein